MVPQVFWSHSLVLILHKLDGIDTIPVPRVKQRITYPTTGKTCYCIQYPIILSWAVTAHHCLGITVKKGCSAYEYLDNSFFADGQAYVCLSRVETFEQIHLLSFYPAAIFASSAVRNIVDTAKRTGKLIMVKCEKRNIVQDTTIDKSIIDSDIKIKDVNDTISKNLTSVISVSYGRQVLLANKIAKEFFAHPFFNPVDLHKVQILVKKYMKHIMFILFSIYHQNCKNLTKLL